MDMIGDIWLGTHSLQGLLLSWGVFLEQRPKAEPEREREMPSSSDRLQTHRGPNSETHLLGRYSENGRSKPVNSQDCEWLPQPAVS